MGELGGQFYPLVSFMIYRIGNQYGRDGGSILSPDILDDIQDRKPIWES